MATRPHPAPGLAAIPQLDFAVLGAAPVEHAAVPTLALDLRVTSAGGHAIRSVLLDVQVQIAARRRPYDARAQERLSDLFGTPDRWGTTLRTLPWVRLTRVVPGFEDSTVVDLPVTCTYDLEVAAARYLDALGDGEVPLELLFSGTVFHAAADGRLQAARIPWDREAEYRLPVAVWRATMDRHFPDSGWLRLRRESLGRLAAYRARHTLATWEDALGALLDAAGDGR